MLIKIDCKDFEQKTLEEEYSELADKVIALMTNDLETLKESVENFKNSAPAGYRFEVEACTINLLEAATDKLEMVKRKKIDKDSYTHFIGVLANKYKLDNKIR